MQSLLCGVGHHGVLAVHFFLWKLIHHLSHAALTAEAHAAEAFALAVSAIFVEFDFNEV
jgi:hypothetical protein